MWATGRMHFHIIHVKRKQGLYWITGYHSVRSKAGTPGHVYSKSRNPSRLHASVKRSRLANKTQKYQAFIIISHQGHKDGVEVVVRCRKVAETPRELKDKEWQNIDAVLLCPRRAEVAFVHGRSGARVEKAGRPDRYRVLRLGHGVHVLRGDRF